MSVGSETTEILVERRVIRVGGQYTDDQVVVHVDEDLLGTLVLGQADLPEKDLGPDFWRPVMKEVQQSTNRPSSPISHKYPPEQKLVGICWAVSTF